MINRSKDALCFRVELQHIAPAIWRQFWVPARYSFWGLHLAIQDSMGWLDCHLHEFEVSTGITGESLRFGIPDEEMLDTGHEVLPGWEHAIVEYLSKPGETVRYEYDFGDSWVHTLTLTEVSPRQVGTTYPSCVAGARACPPEDCGGPPGYFELVHVLTDPAHPEHDELEEWVGPGWDPAHFEPAQVHYDNPKTRWRHAFED